MSNNIGGFFCGKPLPQKGDEDKTRRIRQYAFVWGRALRDAEDHLKKTRCVTFYVRYGEEPNPQYRGEKGQRRVLGKFIKCQINGGRDAADVMAAVERQDVVLCFGRTVRDYRETKDGDRCYYYMTVDVIIPMGLISFLLRLYNSRTIRRILDEEDNEAADEWQE